MHQERIENMAFSHIVEVVPFPGLARARHLNVQAVQLGNAQIPIIDLPQHNTSYFNEVCYDSVGLFLQERIYLSEVEYTRGINIAGHISNVT